MHDLSVSIIICTRNRAASLRLTLMSMAEVRVPDAMKVELLVVDNGSTDHTKEVVERVRLLNMTLRSLYESKPGLSVARNAGLRASTRDIVVFTDDDVRPAADWLIELVEPITSGRADAVGGRVIIPEDRRVAWFAPLHRSWLASTERCENGPAELVGANMAFRRDVWKGADAFDVNLGAGALGFGEDRLFSLRLQSDGCRIAFAPNAVVEHHFDLSRVNRTYFLSLAEKMGRSEAYLAYHWFNKADSWCGAMEGPCPEVAIGHAGFGANSQGFWAGRSSRKGSCSRGHRTSSANNTAWSSYNLAGTRAENPKHSFHQHARPRNHHHLYAQSRGESS